MGTYAKPDNIVTLRINRRGSPDPNGGLFEYFYRENVPPEHRAALPQKSQSQTLKDQLL
jgi:hypothetical protein